jgi:Profilin
MWTTSPMVYTASLLRRCASYSATSSGPVHVRECQCALDIALNMRLPLSRVDVVTSAGIYGQEGITWAKSDDWDVSAASVVLLVNALLNNASPPTSVPLNGRRYMMLRCDIDTGTAYLRTGGDGVVAVLTKMGVLICKHLNNNSTASQAMIYVTKVADHLKNAGV